MTKYNKKTPDSVKLKNRPDATVNYEGGLAFSASPKNELTIRFLTFLVGEPKFYTSGAEDTEEIADLIAEVSQFDPEYIMKLASYARNKMYLRSAPLFALVEGVSYDNVRPFVKEYTPEIVKRADEITETLAYYIARNGQIGDGIVQGASSGIHGSLANSLKKGLAEAFHSFDEYQFAKYNRKGEVTFKDALRMVHPKPKTAEHAELFKKILDDTLATPVTWEVVLSTMTDPETGAKFATKKEAWEFVLNRMGFMAKLRNLRNMSNEGVDMTPVLEHLTNPKAVANSKQFPFRFFSAWKAAGGGSFAVPIRRAYSFGRTNPFVHNEITDALETAMELSIVNLPKLKGKTFTSSDNSGSMTSPISQRSTVTCNEVANVMASLTYHMCDKAIASVFGTDFAVVPLNKKDSILTNTEKLIDTYVDYSTNAWLALRYLNSEKIDVDRIFIFSDMQCYDVASGYGRSYESLANEYAKYKKINPNVKLYSWNLVGYNTLQFPEDDRSVVTLSGWSDNVLKFIPAFEEFGSGSMIQEIEKYCPEPLVEEETEEA